MGNIIKGVVHPDDGNNAVSSWESWGLRIAQKGGNGVCWICRLKRKSDWGLKGRKTTTKGRQEKSLGVLLEIIFWSRGRAWMDKREGGSINYSTSGKESC